MCHKGSHCIVVTKGSMISFWLYLFCHAINDDVRICTTNFVARLNEPRFLVPILNGSFFFTKNQQNTHAYVYYSKRVFLHNKYCRRLKISHRNKDGNNFKYKHEIQTGGRLTHCVANEHKLQCLSGKYSLNSSL